MEPPRLRRAPLEEEFRYRHGILKRLEKGEARFDFLTFVFALGKLNGERRSGSGAFWPVEAGTSSTVRMQQIIELGACDAKEFEQLGERAARELSMGGKRRFIYNVAQLCQAQGSLSTMAYVNILDVAENLGVSDVEADSIIHSVYTLNDTFIAIMGVLALGAILYFTQAVIVPLVVAIFITMIIHKVERLIASGLSIHRFRWLTTLGAMIAILAGIFGLVVAAVASGTDIANRRNVKRETEYPHQDEKGSNDP